MLNNFIEGNIFPKTQIFYIAEKISFSISDNLKSMLNCAKNYKMTRF